MATKGIKQTIEHIHKRRLKLIGKKVSPETKEKIRLTKLKNRVIRLESPRKPRKNLGNWWTGKKRGKMTDEHKNKLRLVKIGKTVPIETRKKLSISHKNRVSQGLHNNYKGGVTDENRKLRLSFEYRLWREAVMRRDNWTCIWCGAKFIKGITGHVPLQVDHIKPFAHYPELRLAIDNGRTLCKKCHLSTDTWGNRSYNKPNR